jgi:hypothetical protein
LAALLNLLALYEREVAKSSWGVFACRAWCLSPPRELILIATERHYSLPDVSYSVRAKGAKEASGFFPTQQQAIERPEESNQGTILMWKVRKAPPPCFLLDLEILSYL